MINVRPPPLGAGTPQPGAARPARIFQRYYLTREPDIPTDTRLRTACGALVVALLAFGLAWRDIAGQHVSGLLGLGLGRLALLAERGGWPGAWLASALEFVHFGLVALVFAVTLWFGAARRAPTLPGEETVFVRRQSPWIAANAGAGGIGCVIVGLLLASRGMPLLSVPVEVVGLSMLGTAIWQLLVPEARIALAVVLDANMGWGNRIMLSGGVFRLGSRLTIRKDDFVDANARDAGRLEMLGGARSILLRFRDAHGAIQQLHLRGISHDPEAALLAGLLNSVFTLALTRETLIDTIRLNRLPPGIR